MQCAGASCETLQAPSNLAQIFCGLETNLLHTDAFPQREGCLYKGLLLHRDAFHKDTLLHRRLHIQMLLPWDPFTHKYLYTQAPLHRYVFTQRNFYTQTLGCFYTQMPLHSDAFTQECFYTEALLHRDSFDRVSFTHRSFHTHAYKNLRRELILRRNTFMQRRFFQHR